MAQGMTALGLGGKSEGPLDTVKAIDDYVDMHRDALFRFSVTQ